MFRIILHSDDFGLHSAVNRAILEAAAKGVLNSASLMANGAAFDEAVGGLARCPALGIGVHLNILRGSPLSDPAEVPSLVDGEGRFFNSMAKLMVRSAMGLVNEREVFAEYRRQVRRILDAGVRPTHFDGEKHSHLLLPEAARAVAGLAAEYGITRVRSIREAGLTRSLQRAGVPVGGGLRQRLKLALLEFRARQADKIWAGLSRPTATFGVTISGSPDPRAWADMLRRLLVEPGEGVVEWMFHLGYPFDEEEGGFRREFGQFFLGASRHQELRFLLSDEVGKLIAEHRHRFGSYEVL